YLNPIFKAYSNHKYDTGDYMEIDPMFGTQADFERLAKMAEEKGIRLVLDGVFNHTGSDSKYFNKKGTYDSVGAYQSEKSPYSSWYRFSHFPDEYESWWGIDTLPQVEENSKEYQEFILTQKDSVVKHWLKKGASGWRLDVVDELPDFFVKILRKEVKKTKKDAVIIGEVWEDASNKVAYGESRQYFMGEELDSVMNYPLKNAMLDFACGTASAEEFNARIMSLKENYPKECFYSLFNFLSSHDTVRVLTALGDKRAEDRDAMSRERLNFEEKKLAKQKLKCLVTMQMLMPGVPVVYYGDEAGMEGYADPFCRRCYPWGAEDRELVDFYRNTIALRKSSKAFSSGEFEPVYTFSNGYGFVRYNDEEGYIVLVNMGDEQTFRVDVSRFSMEKIVSKTGEKYQSCDGIYYIPMGRYEAKVFCAKNII
ncbi:MAG: glycoside hydrolase family 13 protein, partial [Ruminococcaceae bacterium]|nr:glycoside hydrolase family 13 protein [Oscillospiraceae bacterium]